SACVYTSAPGSAPNPAPVLPSPPHRARGQIRAERAASSMRLPSAPPRKEKSMKSLRSILLAGTALSFLALPALAGTALAAPSRPLVLAPAEEITDPVVLAPQKTVEDARAALRDAMANGGDVRAARKALNEALKALHEGSVAHRCATTRTI